MADETGSRFSGRLKPSFSAAKRQPESPKSSLHFENKVQAAFYFNALFWHSL